MLQHKGRKDKYPVFTTLVNYFSVFLHCALWREVSEENIIRSSGRKLGVGFFIFNITN